MSAPVTATVVVAELLEVTPSLVAPVEPVTVDEPTAVGVPVTLQVMLAPAETVVGGVGVQVVERPAGSPDTEQVAAVADSAGEAALEQVNEPV